MTLGLVQGLLEAGVGVAQPFGGPADLLRRLRPRLQGHRLRGEQHQATEFRIVLVEELAVLVQLEDVVGDLGQPALVLPEYAVEQLVQVVAALDQLQADVVDPAQLLQGRNQ